MSVMLWHSWILLSDMPHVEPDADNLRRVDANGAQVVMVGL